MDPRIAPAASVEPTSAATGTVARRAVLHALVVLLAATLAWLIVAAYRQPDLILDLAGMRLC